MELKKDICPHCGGTDMVKGKQVGQGSIVPSDAWTLLGAQPVYHIVCKDCGTVVRSYVEKPENLFAD